MGEGKAKEWSDKGFGRKGRHQDGENTHNEEALMRKEAKGERERKKKSAKEESKGKDERREKRAINPKEKEEEEVSEGEKGRTH